MSLLTRLPCSLHPTSCVYLLFQILIWIRFEIWQLQELNLRKLWKVSVTIEFWENLRVQCSLSMAAMRLHYHERMTLPRKGLWTMTVFPIKRKYMVQLDKDKGTKRRISNGVWQLYLRVHLENGSNKVSLVVASKSRVAYIKTVTLPWLELWDSSFVFKISRHY